MFNTRFLRRTLVPAAGLALMAGVTGCEDTPTSEPDPSHTTNLTLPVEVTLAPGFTVQFEEANLRLRFDHVVGDSRCPTNALILCVWEGSAIVSVVASRISGEEKNLVILNLETVATRNSGTAYGIPVRLVRVDPVPTTTDPIPASSYRVVLKVGDK